MMFADMVGHIWKR